MKKRADIGRANANARGGVRIWKKDKKRLKKVLTKGEKGGNITRRLGGKGARDLEN